MSEKEILAEDIFSLLKSPKAGYCPVRGCTKAVRAKGRSFCPKHDKQLWRARNPIRSAYNNLRHHAKQRSVEFNITLEEFNQLEGVARYAKDIGRSSDALHIDRVDPCIGYTVGNIRVLRAGDNIAKGNVERRNLRYRIHLFTRLGYLEHSAELLDELMLFDSIVWTDPDDAPRKPPEPLNSNCPF